METITYIALKKERRAILARLKAGNPLAADLSRLAEIRAAIKADPPTLDQQYAAAYE